VPMSPLQDAGAARLPRAKSVTPLVPLRSGAVQLHVCPRPPRGGRARVGDIALAAARAGRKTNDPPTAGLASRPGGEHGLPPRHGFSTSARGDERDRPAVPLNQCPGRGTRWGGRRADRRPARTYRVRQPRPRAHRAEAPSSTRSSSPPVSARARPCHDPLTQPRSPPSRPADTSPYPTVTSR
jgi:hypothetical protein